MRRLRKDGPGTLLKQTGFTLLETVLAVGIIALIGVGVVRAIDTNARAGRVLDEQVQATNLITAYLEGIRQLPYDNSSNAYASVAANVAVPYQYSVILTTEYSGNGITWQSSPYTTSGELKLQRITISVFRTNGELVLSTCTYRAKR